MTVRTLTPETPDLQARTHTPTMSPSAPDQTQKQHDRRARGYFALALILGLADVILIKSTYNAILGDDELISLTLAVVTAIGATVLAWASGSYAASAYTHRNRSHTILAAVTGTAWALLGVGLFWLRWNAAELGNTDVVVEGQSTAGDAAATHTDQVLAVVLITLFVMPGLIAFAHAFDLGNPIAALQRATHARVAALQTQLPHDEARASELALILHRHHAELDQVPTNAQTAKNAAHDLAAELKAFAAAEVARQIGDPSAVPGPTTHPNPAVPGHAPDTHAA